MTQHGHIISIFFLFFFNNNKCLLFCFQVETVGERVVLYVLNRIVYRAKEKSKDEVPFLCHSENDFAKIIWKNGEAIGFYSVKPEGSLFIYVLKTLKTSCLTVCTVLYIWDHFLPYVCSTGSLCSNFLTQRYQLPVLDSMFVRKCHRGYGHGLQILEDFVDSFRSTSLGLKYPLSPALYKGNNVTTNLRLNIKIA